MPQTQSGSKAPAGQSDMGSIGETLEQILRKELETLAIRIETTVRQEVQRAAAQPVQGRTTAASSSFCLDGGTPRPNSSSSEKDAWGSRPLTPLREKLNLRPKTVVDRSATAGEDLTGRSESRRTEESSKSQPARALSLMGNQEGGASYTAIGSSRPGTIAEFVKGETFDRIIALALFLNTISIGYETDYRARNWDHETPWIFSTINEFFCAVFVFEVVMRIYAVGFWPSVRESSWFSFNLGVVVLQVLDEIMKYVKHHMNLQHTSQVLSLLRSIRIMRMFRLLDKVHAVDELRLLFTSIVGSMKSLMCSVFVIFLFTFIFGVPLTQMVADFKAAHKGQEEEEEAAAELDRFYGNLEKTMMSLFQSVSDGIHWRELMDPLAENCSPWWQLAFVFYISFCVFAMMNILTGIFVESAMATAETEKRTGILLESMRKIFMEADVDQSGKITWEEFSSLVRSHKDMQDYLRLLDIGEDRAKQLFHLLDDDASGEIDSEEFVGGCLRLQGNAKAIDFAAFVQEWHRFVEGCRHEFRSLRTSQ